MKLYGCLLGEDQLALAIACAKSLGLSLEEISESYLGTLDSSAILLIAENKGLPFIPEATVGVLTTRFWDIPHLEALVKTPHVAGVIPYPASERELSALIRKLAGYDLPDTRGSMREQLSAKLIEMFENELYPRLREILELADAALESRTKKDLEEVKKRVHKLAGTAGTFGYARATDLCRQLEYQLDQEIKRGQDLPFEDSEAAKLRPALYEILLSFQHIYLTPPEPLSGEVSTEPKKKDAVKPSLYVITQNLEIGQSFQTLCYEAHLDVLVETDPNLALEQLKADKQDPTCLVVHYYYPLHHLHGKELIDAYRAQTKLHNPKVALISAERSMSERMEEMQTGIDYFLKYPISDEHISALLSSLISESALSGSKVLVVDDDLAICGLIEDALREIGVQTRSIQDETKILETLDAFTPDVLLLDLGLNTYKGTEILKLLRSDTRSMGLPIVIITVSSDRATLDLAVEYGANIVIQKPIDLNYLKLTLNNLLTSRERTDLLTLRDPLTGLLHPLVFQNKLKEAVEFYRAHDETVLLLLIGIKDYQRLTKELPQKTRNDILIALSNVLRGTFSISHLSAYRAPGTFECYFENVDPNHIQFLFQEFMRRAHRELTHLEYHSLEFAAGAASALLPSDDYKSLLETAENNLKLALQKEGNHFLLSETGKGKVSKSLKPFCVIVDDDKDLTNVLEYAFKRKGFDVVSIHTGQEALHYFAALKKLPHNFVVILDRVLPDMDGFDIFKNLKAKFSENLKVIFLSTLGGEEDTLMGLKEGAYDYLSKPVSIDILIQKAKNILEL